MLWVRWDLQMWILCVCGCGLRASFWLVGLARMAQKRMRSVCFTWSSSSQLEFWWQLLKPMPSVRLLIVLALLSRAVVLPLWRNFHLCPFFPNYPLPPSDQLTGQADPSIHFNSSSFDRVEWQVTLFLSSHSLTETYFILSHPNCVEAKCVLFCVTPDQQSLVRFVCESSGHSSVNTAKGKALSPCDGRHWRDVRLHESPQQVAATAKR